MRTKWKDKLQDIKEALLSGKTLEEVAHDYEVTKQRMHQIVSKYLPELKRSEYGCSLKKRIKRETQVNHWLEKYNRSTWFADELSMAQSRYFTRKRQNVKNRGKWEFAIQMSDVPEWPTHCPILGIELDWFSEYRKENSPSLDRIDPLKGYIAGNVQIVSWRANRIKNDGSASEHRLIAEYLDKLSGVSTP